MDYFKELTDQGRKDYEDQKDQIEQDMAPFGFMDDGLGDTSLLIKRVIDGSLMSMGIWHICGNIGNGFRWSD